MTVGRDMGKIRELKMSFLINMAVDKYFPPRETVLLNFDKKDSQIARNWRESSDKDIFDDKN
jgi:hypothetical protein